MTTIHANNNAQVQDEVDLYLVEFDDPDDTCNPKNGTRRRRWYITLSLAFLLFTATWASFFSAADIGAMQSQFQIDKVMATLGVSNFVFGLVIGSILFGYISEILGHNIPLFVGFACFAAFQILVALANDITTFSIGRSLTGLCAGAPLAVMSGIISNLWDVHSRVYAVCLCAFGTFAGPIAGLLAGHNLIQLNLGWRWTSWITLIISGAVGSIAIFIVPETSAARILYWRAAQLRKETGDSRYYAAVNKNKLTIYNMVIVYVARPFIMLIQEPSHAIMAYFARLRGDARV